MTMRMQRAVKATCSGRSVLTLTAFLIAGAFSSEALARGQVGEHAPWFELERLTGGKVAAARLHGRPAVLVVGRTQRAASPCKEWAFAIIERYASRLPVFQVIVVDKSWFIPKSLVYAKVKSFVPATLHDRVLLEWHTAFAEAYGIDKQDEPVLLVLDSDAVIRWRYQGAMNHAALARLGRAVGALAAPARTPAAALSAR